MHHLKECYQVSDSVFLPIYNLGGIRIDSTATKVAEWIDLQAVIMMMPLKLSTHGWEALVFSNLDA